MPKVRTIDILKIFQKQTGRKDAKPAGKRKAPVALGPVADKSGATLVEAVITIAIVFCVIFILVIALLKPYYEARSFNECTGGHATYMTALTTELRVQDCKN